MASDWSANEAPKVARAYVLHLARTYQPGCVLAAACDLDLFEALGADAIEAQEIAERIRGDLRGTTILLDALAAIELIDKRDGRYLVPEAMRDLLSPGTPDSVLAMVQHQANCMRRWARLAETVRDGAQVETAPSVRGPARDTAAFIEAMDVINRGDAQRIVDELMPIQFDHLLDVGGASGTWTIAWLRANPRAQATLFDLPEVLPQAEDRLGSVGLMDRVDLVAGDFYSDRLPEGPDLAWISAIVHQNSRAENRDLFRKVSDALQPGGRILIRDVVMDETRTRPPGGALFAVNMLSGTPGGGTYTLRELREDLEAAGFADVDQLREDEWMHSVVGATSR